MPCAFAFLPSAAQNEDEGRDMRKSVCCLIWLLLFHLTVECSLSYCLVDEGGSGEGWAVQRKKQRYWWCLTYGFAFCF